MVLNKSKRVLVYVPTFSCHVFFSPHKFYARTLQQKHFFKVHSKESQHISHLPPFEVSNLSMFVPTCWLVVSTHEVCLHPSKLGPLPVLRTGLISDLQTFLLAIVMAFSLSINHQTPLLLYHQLT